MGVEIRQLTDIALVVALVGTGLGAGLQATSHPREWLADRRWLGTVLAINVLAYPLIATLLAALLGLDAEMRTALILVSACAGGLAGLVITRMVDGDVERAIVAVLILELLNLLTVPLWSSVLLSTTAPVQFSDVVRPLLLFLLLPVVSGLVIARVRPGVAPGLVRIARPVSTIALIVVVAGVLQQNVPVFLDAMGSGLPIAGAVLLAAGMSAGWLLGGPTPASRRTMAMVTAGHATALALAVARSAFGTQPQVEASIAVLGVLGLAVPTAVALVIRASARMAVPAAPAGG